LSKAASDLATATVLYDLGEAHLEHSVFHSQQAAEKFLKAWLDDRGERFPKTHDLLILVKQVESIDQAVGAALVGVPKLTTYAVQVRYDESIVVSRAMALEAVTLAKLTRDTLFPALNNQA